MSNYLKLFFLNILLMFLSLPAAQAMYESKTALLEDFHAAGFNYVFEIQSGYFSNNKVHVPSQSGKTREVSLSHFIQDVASQRISQLDYDGGSLFNKVFQAYKVDNSYICYINNMSTTDGFSHCFFMPVEIDQVLRALDDIKKNKEQPNN